MKQKTIMTSVAVVAVLLPAMLYYPTFDNELDIPYWPPVDAVVSQMSKMTGFFTDEVQQRTVQTYAAIDENVRPDPRALLYRPLALVYFAVEYSLLGDHWVAHRIVNLVSYSVTTVLFFFLVYVLTQDLGIACLAVLLYTVDYTRRVTMLETAYNNPILYMAAVLCFVKSRRTDDARQKRVLLLISYCCAVYAQFVYEVFASLPLIITLIEWIQGKLWGQWKPHYKSLMLYYLLPVLYVAATSVVYHGAPILAFSSAQYSTIISNVFLLWTFLLRLFVPVDIITMRRALRLTLFGGASTREIFSAHSTMLVIFMIVSLGVLAYAIYRLSQREALRRFFLVHRTGRLLLLGSGWMVLATLPALLVQFGDQRLMVSILGACLVKAALIDFLATRLSTWTHEYARPVVSGMLTALLVLYHSIIILSQVQEVEYGVDLRHRLVNEIGPSVQQATRDRPLYIYVFNFTGSIGTGQIVGSDVTFTYFLRKVVGRNDLIVKTPYSLWHPSLVQYQRSVYPRVEAAGGQVFVVDNADPEQPIGSLGLAVENIPTFYARAQRFRKAKSYEIELLQVHESTGVPTRLSVTILPPSGVNVLVFANEKGHYVLLQSTLD